MIKPIIAFSIKLVIALSIVFGIHLLVLSYSNVSIYQNLIIPSYIANIFLAIIIYSSLFKLRIKYLDLLGFIFMAGSFLKFAVYFIFFNPSFKTDGIVSSIEATSFLIPYLACLIIETYFLIKLLNSKQY